ncbi:hypothetical protein ALC56_06554 [Trachymyrmex septentrionalis]|uniref:Spaetzle domain-containing protein n=1 Tax=Trachymyrmex septentrionalis TaxID=34720 RepID=A0A195FFG8_9HYME|nr:PREDICTED: uncharacterized protein LOC108748669 [Trachymyrmex septentrionalis]KYN39128.1 hypothetical protein ALC56_06554 [Trachymyrmex septentrionalis]
MAIFSVRSCLPVLVAYVIVNIPLVQGRSLRRRHGHHSHLNYYNFEESLPRDLSGRRLDDDLEYYHDFQGRKKSREYPQVLDRSLAYGEDSEERVPMSFHRYKHEYDSRDRGSLRKDFPRKHNDFNALSMRFVARRKRHNKFGTVASYHRFNPRDVTWRFEDELRVQEKVFELEVKQAQNSSICNYTVESIPDTRGTRVPKDLEHVRCNHIGSSCQGTGTYCCIQTYRNIEVSYGDGDTETMKLYVGCVCALQVFDSMMGSEISISD